MDGTTLMLGRQQKGLFAVLQFTCQFTCQLSIASGLFVIHSRINNADIMLLLKSSVSKTQKLVVICTAKKFLYWFLLVFKEPHTILVPMKSLLPFSKHMQRTCFPRNVFTKRP